MQINKVYLFLIYMVWSSSISHF